MNKMLHILTIIALRVCGLRRTILHDLQVTELLDTRRFTCTSFLMPTGLRTRRLHSKVGQTRNTRIQSFRQSPILIYSWTMSGNTHNLIQNRQTLLLAGRNDHLLTIPLTLALF